MATSKDGVTSDTEGQEKPVRKQLQKASISRASGETLETSTQPDEGMEGQEDQAGASAQPADKAPAAPELRKKRSFEEVGDPESDDRPAAHTRSAHTRKRSRDSTAEEDELNNGRKISGERKRDDTGAEGAIQSNGAPQPPTTDRPGTPEPKGGKRGEEKVEAMTSPKTKRSRLHSATVEGETGAAAALSEENPAESAIADEESEKLPGGSTADTEAKVPSEARSPIPPGSGFANTSATSPFGAIASPKSPPSDEKRTSASAFAASGFGSLAGSTSSGFGALGNSSGKPAGGWSSKPSGGDTNGTDKPVSTFGGALGQQSAFGSAASSASPFGSSGTSAFGGKLGTGSVFGGSGFSSLGGGGGLSSFASGKASPFASSGGPAKPARPFGAPADDDDNDGEENGEDDESGLKSPLSQESDKQDERFFAQEHETGEEGEVTAYSCRAKLYNFAVVDEGKGKKEWKERGLGTVRLNTARVADDGEEGEGEEEGKAKAAKSRARLVMRADGSHRLILNTPVQKGIKFGAADGGPPQGGLMLFMGAVDGKEKLEMLQLKVSFLIFFHWCRW